MTNETSWHLYTTNTEAWNAMLTACLEAKESIDLEAYIFLADEIGKHFIEACALRAAEGVKVRFIWDAQGSFTFLGSSIVEDLKQKGIELIFFRTIFPKVFTMHDYRSWYFRNHRRTLVVDGRIGFTGSVCISKNMESWRDTQIRIEGPVVKDMDKAFERMWDRAQGNKVPKYYRDEHADHEFEYVTNAPFPRNRKLYNQTIEAIRNARRYIYITTPYFVPTHQLFRILRLAAHRGVEVKIIIPEGSDYPVVDLGARTFFTSLLKAGVRIYLYKGKMMHSKTIVIDGDWSSIGTMNLDHISLLHNFEASIVTTNSRFAEELASHFVFDLQSSHEITYADWKRRFFGEKLAGFFIKFVRRFL